jgi:hypothetical protein
MCRNYTAANVKRLAGFASGPEVEHAIAIRAIEILLGYGHGRPKQEHKHEGTAPDGSHVFVVRHIYEGKPKGEK